MKRLLLLSILFASLASAQTDTSLFVWVQNGKVYVNQEIFQRWSGHFWDTLATKRYARSIAGSGGGGVATIGDTVVIRGNKFYIMKWIEAVTDSVYATVDLNGIPIPAGVSTITTGVIYATNYTNPPGTFIGDDQAIDVRANLAIHIGAAPPHATNADLYLYYEVWRPDLLEWKTAADQEYSNAIGYFPYWDDLEHTWNVDVGDPLSYYVGGYAKYKQYYGTPRNTFWDWGVAPLNPLYWRLRANRTGRVTATFGRELVGTNHYGSVFVFGPQYTWPAHYKTLMTIDTAGTLTVFGDLNTMAGTIKGHDAHLSYIQLGFYPSQDSALGYRAYPDTVAGYVMLLSNETGTAGIGASGGNGAAGFNQTFWLKIDTIVGANDTITTYGHSAKESASGTRIETIEADSNVTLTMTGLKLKIKGKQPLRYVGTTTNLKYLTLDSNMVAHVSGDTLHLAATSSGGSGASSSYITKPADKPSASPNALDDEFNLANGSLPDTTTKWKWRDRGASCVLVENSGILTMTDTTKAAADNIRILEQTTGDTAWSITARISVQQPVRNYSAAGLAIVDSANGRLYTFVNRTEASGNFPVIYAWNSVTSYNSTPWAGIAGNVGSVAQYFKIEKTTGKVLNFYLSSDGIKWGLVYTVASTAFVETAGNRVNRVGICAFAYLFSSTAFAVNGNFWWFRYNWTPDFDATVNK